MVHILVRLIFTLNNPLKIQLHQGQYLSMYNIYIVEILPQLREGIFQATLKNIATKYFSHHTQ